VNSRRTHTVVVMALVALLALGVVMSSCDLIFEPEDSVRFYKVRVDSIAVTPSQPHDGDTLRIAFFGTVGGNTCHSFSHFGVRREDHRLDITVWGKERLGDIMCGDAMVFLEGREYTVHPLVVGELLIVVHQPDCTTLEESVQVSASGRSATPN